MNFLLQIFRIFASNEEALPVFLALPEPPVHKTHIQTGAPHFMPLMTGQPVCIEAGSIVLLGKKE